MASYLGALVLLVSADLVAAPVAYEYTEENVDTAQWAVFAQPEMVGIEYEKIKIFLLKLLLPIQF